MKEKLSKLSKRELVLLGILVIIAVYYFGVQLPVSRLSEPVASEKAAVEAELTEAQTKAIQQQKMSAELADYEKSGAAETPSYDNTNDIIMEMNTVLGGQGNYTITFGDTEKEGNIVRRPIDLQFSAATYNDAVRQIRKLEQSDNGYLLNDTAITGGSTTAINSDGTTSTSNQGNYTVTVSMTSFEYVENK